MPTQIDLFGLDAEIDRDVRAEMLKRDLRNLLTSYADEADVFVEIIQNAFDAIILAQESGLYSEAVRPRLDIVLGLPGNDPHYLCVIDNGVGMTPEVAQRFTSPGYSHGKHLGRTVGYKGVGASFFFAAANRIGLLTKNADGAATESTVHGAYAWIMNDTEPRPRTDQDAQFPSYVCSNGLLPSVHGTAVCYYCHNSWKPKNLSRLVKKDSDADRELKNWATYLCAKTALGQVSDISSRSITVHLHLVRDEVTCSQEWKFGEFSRENQQLGYPYPWRLYAVHANLADILDTPRERLQEHKNMHPALRLRWERADVLALTPPIEFSADEEQLVQEHLEFADVYFGYSTEILAKVHERSGCSMRQIRYGIRIASDGVPQGRMTEFDLTSNQGLSRQAHALMAFAGLELDTGRKIPSNELVTEVVRKLGVRAMTTLADSRWYMKKSERRPPTSEIAGWREQLALDTQDSLVVRLFEKLGVTAPLVVDPASEDDVIALFASMLSLGTIKGYRLCALSGSNRYDALVHIDPTTPILKDTEDPLSMRDTPPALSGEPAVLEFKHQLKALIVDFEDRVKNPREVDILVCWELPAPQVTRGRIKYCYGDRKDHRGLYAVSHIWKDDNDTDSVYIISLKHVVADLLRKLEGTSPGVGAATFNSLLTTDRDHSV